jgi:hypothetical protein
VTTTPDPLAAIARNQERTDRRLDKLVEQVTGLAGDIARVARATGKGRGGPGDDEEEPPLASWLLVEDVSAALALLDDLLGWLDAVYLRWEGAALPSCWLWHPDMVEELLALREQHREAYAGERRSWKAVGDWLDRRVKVVERLGPLQTCELILHVPGGERDRPERRAALRSALELIAHDWSLARALPEPTPELLSQAQRHDHEHDLTPTS